MVPELGMFLRLAGQTEPPKKPICVFSGKVITNTTPDGESYRKMVIRFIEGGELRVLHFDLNTVCNKALDEVEPAANVIPLPTRIRTGSYTPSPLFDQAAFTLRPQ